MPKSPIDLEALYPYVIKYLSKQYRGKVTEDEFEEMVYWTIERALRYQHKYDPSRGTVSTWICTIANSAYSRVLTRRPHPGSSQHRDAWISKDLQLVGLPGELDDWSTQPSPEDALITAIDLKLAGIDPFRIKRAPRKARSKRKH